MLKMKIGVIPCVDCQALNLFYVRLGWVKGRFALQGQSLPSGVRNRGKTYNPLVLREKIRGSMLDKQNTGLHRKISKRKRGKCKKDILNFKQNITF